MKEVSSMSLQPLDKLERLKKYVRKVAQETKRDDTFPNVS